MIEDLQEVKEEARWLPGRETAPRKPTAWMLLVHGLCMPEAQRDTALY